MATIQTCEPGCPTLPNFSQEAKLPNIYMNLPIFLLASSSTLLFNTSQTKWKVFANFPLQFDLCMLSVPSPSSSAWQNPGDGSNTDKIFLGCDPHYSPAFYQRCCPVPKQEESIIQSCAGLWKTTVSWNVTDLHISASAFSWPGLYHACSTFLENQYSTQS